MQRIGILHHHVIFPLGGVQRLAYPLRRKIKAYIPAGIYISSKGKVKQISMSTPKKGCHFSKRGFGVVKPTRGRVLEIQVIGIEARAQTNLLGQSKINWFGSRSNIA